MDNFDIVVCGREIQISVWESGLRRFEANSWLEAAECHFPHSGCAVNDAPMQFGRWFHGGGDSAAEAVRVVTVQLEAAVIPVRCAVTVSTY
jgi:hypothetical protein